MRSIRLPDDVDDVEATVWKSLRGQPASRLHYEEIVAPPARIEWPDGTLAAVYGEIDSRIVDDELRHRLPAIPPRSGIRTGGLETRSRQFGARPRYPLRQREFCGPCTMNGEEPDTYERLVRVGNHLTSWYADARPDLLVAQTDWVEREILPEYRMAGPYTSGIINLENALNYHRDAGNVRDSWNAMFVVREDTIGGLFVVPAWRLAFEAGDRHAIVLDAQRSTHGVTAIQRIRATGFRVSVVYYSLKALAVCGTCEEEAVRARRVRTEREQRRAGLIP